MSKDPHALVVPDGTEVIKNGEYSGKDYERVFIPKSVTEIEESAFEDCENLREVVFEEGSKLKVVGREAFRNCNKLTRMTFPEGFEKIGIFSF